MTVLDLSSYDLPTLDAPCMASSGVSGVILGVYSNTNAPAQMAGAATRLRDAGIEILGFYGLIYHGSAYGRTRDTKWAVDLAKRFGVKRVWLDCEIDGEAVGFTDLSPVTPGSRVRDIQDCVNIVEAAGLEAGIYSAPWWWKPSTSNTSQFSHLPLWFANYPSDGHAMPVLPEPFGGWTKPAIHQYTSSLNICGRNRDANYVFEEEDMALSDNDILAIFGSTEVDLTERLKNAKWRYDEAIRTGNSPFNAASNAIDAINKHRETHPVGGLVPHTHVPGGVA